MNKQKRIVFIIQSIRMVVIPLYIVGTSFWVHYFDEKVSNLGMAIHEAIKMLLIYFGTVFFIEFLTHQAIKHRRSKDDE